MKHDVPVKSKISS